jgi:hypothetical protein
MARTHRYIATLGSAVVAGLSATLLSPYHAGWLLYGVCIALVLLPIRKAIRAFPLGRYYHWVVAHTVLGGASLGVFVVHAGWTMPRLGVNSWVWVLAWVTFVVGIIGLYLNVILPKRIVQNGFEVLFGRVREHQERLVDDVLAVRSRAADGDQETGLPASPAVVDLIDQRVYPFMQRGTPWITALIKTPGFRPPLVAQLLAIRARVEPFEQPQLERLAEAVEDRHRLDVSFVHMAVLRMWVVVHGVFGFALTIAILLHIFWAYNLLGGV